MAKAKIVIGDLPVHTTIGGLVASTLPSGVTQLRKPVNNFNTKSQKFHNMNERIKALDAKFKTLEGTQQAGFEERVLDYGPITICGCPQSPQNGQVLFRSINYARSIFGLGELDDCPNPDPTNNFVQMNFIRNNPADPDPGGATCENFYTVNPVNSVIIQIGEGDDNPAMQVGGISSNYFPDASTRWPDLFDFATGSQFPACVWDNNWFPIPGIQVFILDE